MFKKKLNMSVDEHTIIIKIWHPILKKTSKLQASKFYDYIEIGDIQTAVSNIGDGSLLMEELIEYATQNNYKKNNRMAFIS